MKNQRQVGPKAATLSPPSQSESTAVHQPEKTVSANPDDAPFLTVINIDGRIIENVKLPAPLYAKLVPFLRAAAAAQPAAGDLDAQGGVRLGLINSSSTESTTATVEISEHINERLWQIAKRSGTKPRDAFPKLVLAGLHVAETESQTRKACDCAYDVATELSAFTQLVGYTFRTMPEDGCLRKEDMDHFYMGLHGLSSRLSRALVESLDGIRKTLPNLIQSAV